MLRGPLHNAGPNGRCETCGEVFPCTVGKAIYDAVVRQTPPEPTEREAARPRTWPRRGYLVWHCTCGFTAHTTAAWHHVITEHERKPADNAAEPQPPPVRWEDLADREDRCPEAPAASGRTRPKQVM